MSFFETEFPKRLAYGMTGGAMFSTQVNVGFSGFEQRNRNWTQARGKWSVSVTSKQNDSTGVVTDFDLLRNFNLVVSGMADGFRLFEPTDFSATQASGSGILLPGDGTTKIFQLTKTYRSGNRTYVRNVTKPITASVVDYQNNPLANTVIIYKNGFVQVLGTDYTIDYTTGLITFTNAPANGAIIAADFQFHFPVRFNSDEFMAAIMDSDVKNSKTIVSVTAELYEIRT